MKKQALLKSRQVIFVSFSIFLLSFISLYSQSVEADFLLYSPSPAVTGMGGAGTAIPIDDPYNFFYNPAQLGLSNTNNNLTLGIYPSSVNLSATNTRILFDNYAVQGGYDLSKWLSGFPLSLGAGFIYQGIDFGEFTGTSDSGRVLRKLNPFEKAVTFSLGFGFNYFIRIAGGISYKLIWNNSDLISGSNPYSVITGNTGNADAFDLGLLAEIPILNEIPLTENLRLNLSTSAGYTFANWGSDMVYNSKFGYPIARTARLGYGLRAGINYKYKEAEYKLLQIDWTSEANDLLVQNVQTVNPPDTIYEQGYKTPLGDINFWENVIMMKNTSTSAVNRHGVKFSLFETADISFGGYGKPGTYNKAKGSTLGFSISTKGVMKFLTQELKNEIIEFIANHISFQYSYSSIKFDEYKDDYGYTYKTPDQSYNALYLVISNF